MISGWRIGALPDRLIESIDRWIIVSGGRVVGEVACDWETGDLWTYEVSSGGRAEYIDRMSFDPDLDSDDFLRLLAGEPIAGLDGKVWPESGPARWPTPSGSVCDLGDGAIVVAVRRPL